jgi:hypothetical protein
MLAACTKVFAHYATPISPKVFIKLCFDEVGNIADSCAFFQSLFGKFDGFLLHV